MVYKTLYLIASITPNKWLQTDTFLLGWPQNPMLLWVIEGKLIHHNGHEVCGPIHNRFTIHVLIDILSQFDKFGQELFL